MASATIVINPATSHPFVIERPIARHVLGDWLDVIEDRLVGIKSRELYEAPANAFVAGATDYVTKPINRIELVARVPELLKQHRVDAVISAIGA